MVEIGRKIDIFLKGPEENISVSKKAPSLFLWVRYFS